MKFQPLIWLCTLALLLAASPAAADTNGWTSGKGAGSLTMRDLIPRMSSDEAYSERYGFSVDLDQGGHVGIDFTISNLGWGDAHGAASVRVHLPGNPKYEFSKKLSEDDWTASKSKFALDIAQTSVEGVGNNTFVLRHDGDVKVELTFKNTMPMWRPGTGQITTSSGYYKFGLIAPRADVTGRVQIGGKWHQVSGKRKGYADHVATNVAPFDFATRFSRFRDYNNDVFVIWREIELDKSLGGKSFTWIMIGYKDQIVFSDADAKMTFGRIKNDAKTGYRVPYAVQIDARDGKDTVKFVMRANKVKRKDLLASYGTAAKLVASAVSEPYQFELKGDYVLQMTIGGTSAQVKGRTHYTVDYVKK